MTEPKKNVVGMIQSNYIPWRGYFDFIDEVDTFVIYDDVQYTRKDWRSRNLIKTSTGPAWLTVPVLFTMKHPTLIQDTPISYAQDWIRKHIGTITSAYRNAPYFSEHSPDLFNIIRMKHNTISTLNVELILWAMKILGINTPILFSKDFHPVGVKTDRIIHILKQLSATGYLVGPSAKHYIDINRFKSEHINLEFKSNIYPEYPQLYGTFISNVSVIDLIFNCGEGGKTYIKSMIPNETTSS